MKKRKNFIKSMLLTAMVMLGIGYATISDLSLTADATFTIGDRHVNAQIVSGTFNSNNGTTISTGIVGENSWSISFDATIPTSEVYNVFNRCEFMVQFKNNEEDFSVQIKVTEIKVELDNVELDENMISTVDDGFYLEDENGEGDYGWILPPNIDAYYDLYLDFDESVNLELYSNVSINLTFSATPVAN